MLHAVCYFFSFLVEAIILLQYSSHLFSAKCKQQTTLITLCCFYLTLFAASLLELRGINVTLYFSLNFIFLLTQYYLKWYTALFHSAVLTAVMGMCELMVYGVITYTAPHFAGADRDFVHLAIFAVFNKLIFFTVIYVLIHTMKKTRPLPQQYDRSVFLFAVIPLASIFVMLTLINIGEACILPQSLDWMITLSAVFLLAINLLMLGIYQHNQKKSMEFTELQLLLQKEADSAEYYKMLRTQNENQRILIHDIKKHLQSIELLNEQQEQEKISTYIHQLVLSSDLKEAARLCDQEILNAILCRYMQQCTDKNIAFHTDIRNGTTDFIADPDLTSLFCNLMDNAIAAARPIPDAFIDLNTDKREKTSFVVITLINSSEKVSFDHMHEVSDMILSNNGQHGFGLKSIRKIVAQYHGNMQMYYDDDTRTFHTIITLKNKMVCCD